MTYLMLQMIGGLLISAVLGALLLWLGQVFWGRLVAPVRAKTLEYELEEARADLDTQGTRIEGLQKELEGLTQKIEALQRAKRQLTATLDARNRAMQEVRERLSVVDLEERPSARESAEDLRRELRIAVQERDEANTTLRQAEARGVRLQTELEVLHGIHERMLDDIERLKGRLRDAELEARSSGAIAPARLGDGAAVWAARRLAAARGRRPEPRTHAESTWHLPLPSDCAVRSVGRRVAGRACGRRSRAHDSR